MAKWTNQQRFLATAEDVNRKWGIGQRALLCGICRKRFAVGDGVRWVCATGRGFYNFFVCDDCDTTDVMETWARISRLAQEDEFDLAARIVKLEADLGASAAVEQAA